MGTNPSADPGPEAKAGRPLQVDEIKTIRKLLQQVTIFAPQPVEVSIPMQVITTKRAYSA